MNDLAITCEVAGQPFDLRRFGCRDMGYGQRSALPLLPFRLSFPSSMLAGLVGEACDDFLQTCRQDDALLEESDLPALRDAGYPGIAAMLERHRPLLAELLLDYLYRDLLDAVAARCGARLYRPRRSGDPLDADGRRHFTVNALEKVQFADGEIVLEGQGYFGAWIIWLHEQKQDLTFRP